MEEADGVELARFVARTRRKLSASRVNPGGENAVGMLDVGPGFAAWREVDDHADTPTASSDRVFWLDPARPIVLSDVLEAIALYRSLGRRRAFFTVHPEIWPTTLEAELAAAAPGAGSFARWPHVRYNALARAVAERPGETWRESAFTIRVLTAGDAGELDRVLGEVAPWYGARWLPVLRRAVIDHGAELHVAFDGASPAAPPVSLGGLMADGEWAYVAFAATDPAHRGKGGQTSLFRSRLASARRRGAAWCVGETNTMAAQSLKNFLRCGFSEVVEWQVWGWEEA